MEELEQTFCNPFISSQEEDLAEDLIFQCQFSKALEIYQSLLQNQSCKNSKGTLKYVQILDRIALIHYELCSYKEALEKCNESLRIKSLIKQDDNLHLVENYRLFGMIYRTQAKYADALTNYQKCEEILWRHYSKDHHRLCDVYFERGLFNFEHAKYDAALECYNSSMESILRKESLDAYDKIKIGNCIHEIGKVYKEKKLFKKAEASYEKAKEYKVKELGTEHLDIARIMENEGDLFLAFEEFEKAERIFEKALEIKLKYFEKHIEIAKSYSWLAKVAIKSEKLADALAFEQKVLEMLREFFDENHPCRALSSVKIAHLLTRQTNVDYELALEHFFNAKHTYSKVFGDDHPFIPRILMDIGSIYRFQNKDLQALECYQELVANRVKNQKEDDYILALAYGDMARVLFQQKNYDEAFECQKKSLDLTILKKGRDDMNVAGSYFNLARVLNAQGKTEMSLENYRKSLIVSLKQSSKDHLMIADTFYNMALIDKDLTDYGSAVRNYQASLKHYKIQWGLHHPDIVKTLYYLGKTLKTIEHYDEAATLLNIAFTAQKKCNAKETLRFPRYIKVGLNDIEKQKALSSRNTIDL